MGAGLPPSHLTHPDRTEPLLAPSTGGVPTSAPESPSHSVSMPVRDFERLCREFLSVRRVKGRFLFLQQLCRSVDSAEILVNAKSMLRDTCWGFRQKRIATEGVDHNPKRFADQLVMEGAVLATACYYGLRPKPDLTPAYVQELGDAAKSLLWYGEDTENRRRWADGRALRHLGFALIGGYCNTSDFSVKNSRSFDHRGYPRLAGVPFDLAPQGPVRHKKSSVPHWTVAPETAEA